MKMKIDSKVALRKAGKTKVDSEMSLKAVNSAKWKRVEEAWIWDEATIDCLAQIES